MPKGPKGVRRPADPNARAVMIAKIATGEIEDTPSKAPARAAGGKAGGKARAKALSMEDRQRIAENAASARWKKRS